MKNRLVNDILKKKLYTSANRWFFIVKNRLIIKIKVPLC